MSISWILSFQIFLNFVHNLSRSKVTVVQSGETFHTAHVESNQKVTVAGNMMYISFADFDKKYTLKK